MDLPSKFPDFVIAGAMKCGTTWLHDALNVVDGVFIPRDEVHWIDACDPLVHPDFQSVTRDGLRLRRSKDTSWFHEDHPDARDAELFGYDSTTLIHAQVDFGALAAALPSTRFIVVLRNPVARAYSHYWHLVRTGRARYRFEQEILTGRQEILIRSLYRDGANRMVEAFGPRVLFVCYERIFQEPDAELERIAGFLGLPPSAATAMQAQLAKRSNPGRYPRFLKGWLLGARLLAGLERSRYAADLGTGSGSAAKRLYGSLYWVKIATMAVMAGGFRKSAPKLSEVTRAELFAFFAEANRGLDNVTGVPFHRYWAVE